MVDPRLLSEGAWPMKYVPWKLIADELFARTFQALPYKELPDHVFPMGVTR